MGIKAIDKDKINYKYVFAGLDFLVDKRGEIFFIEANSFPGLLSDLELQYGRCAPLEKLVELFMGPFILVYSKRAVENWREPKFIHKKLNELTNGNCILVSLNKEAISKFDGKLRDPERNIIKDGVVLTPLTKLKPKLEKKYTVINQYSVSRLTKDKLKTYEAVKNLKKIKIPKTFSFRTKAELIKLVKENNLEYFVIKPRFGSGGEDVQICDIKDLTKIIIKNDDWLLQEMVEVKKLNGKYWDVRSFVVNGKYVASLLRVSDNPVVNVGRGGKTRKIDKKLEKRIAPLSEICVSALEAKI